MMIYNRLITSSQNLNKPIRIFFFSVIAIFYVYCAYKSSGYLQEDEHYQIIEFANYKMGIVPLNRLAWEFGAKIRSGLQPLICYFIIKGVKLIGVDDGYNITFILRALTGLSSICAITGFVSSYKKYATSSLKYFYVIISYSLWFLPYINIRFSSENLSGLMLICSLTFLEKSNLCRKNKATILTGIVLGFAILFRYQSFLFISGLFLWLLIIRKVNYKNILILALGIVGVLVLGILIDFWLYGEWTFTAFNYFNINIIKGVASNFGTEPFYQYLLYIVKAPGIFGILILITFVLLAVYYPKNLIVWICIPFLFIHSIIPHKELRFLFPLANLCPLILVIGYQKVTALLCKRRAPIFNSIHRCFVLAPFISINVLFLYAIISTSADGGKFSAAEFIHKNYDRKFLEITVVGEANPFIDWGSVQNSYYSSYGYKLRGLVNVWQQDKTSKTNHVGKIKEILVIKANAIAGPKEIAHLESLGWIKKYQSLPNLTFFLYNFYNRDYKNNQVFIFQKND